jgi:hypothetical protein
MTNKDQGNEATTNDELLIVANDSGLEKPKVEILLSSFGKSYAAAREMAAGANDLVVTDESQTDIIKEARTKRLGLKNIRLEVENTRKQLKEQSLREGKAIDGMANIIKALIIPVENHLENQEKFIERLKEERAATRFAERTAELSKYTDYPEMYNLKDLDDDGFKRILAEAKTAHEAKIAAEAKAEKERKEREAEEAKERERIRLENEQLKKEREEREAEIAREREEAEKQRKAEQEAAEKKAAAERVENEKRLEEERKAAEIERKKREALEREQKEREAAEAKRKAAEEEEKRQALLAPDKQKLIAFADIIDRLELPQVANREAGKLLDETQDFLTRISKNLRNKAREL